MAKNLSFKEFSDRLNKMSKDFQQEVKEIVAVNIGDLELAAIRDASPDYLTTTYGQISEAEQFKKGWRPVSQHIHSREEKGGYSGVVYVDDAAGLGAVYREFSTGQDAANYLSTVEPSWREEARKYFVNGQGKIIGKPYIYPNYLKQRIEFIKELKAALNKLSF